MVVECASKVGCDKIKEHLPESRDIILPILSAAGREEMLNLETKNRIRRKITERLESIITPEKITQIDFSDLSIESGQ